MLDFYTKATWFFDVGVGRMIHVYENPIKVLALKFLNDLISMTFKAKSSAKFKIISFLCTNKDT